jgi:hypothetical protein
LMDAVELMRNEIAQIRGGKGVSDSGAGR